MTNQERMQEWINETRVYFGLNGNGAPQLKRYLSEVQQGVVPTTYWSYDECGHNDEARKEVKAVFAPNNPFDTPKPTRLIERILQIATDKSSIILDSFAGSGTTAHTVLNLNKQDGGNRKFILVEMEDYAETITAERVRRVIGGYGEGKNAVEGTGGSFSYYELGPELLKEGFINEDVPEQTIREYLYYTETNHALPLSNNGHPAHLGTFEGVAYYFLYNMTKQRRLMRHFLRQFRRRPTAMSSMRTTASCRRNSFLTTTSPSRKSHVISGGSNDSQAIPERHHRRFDPLSGNSPKDKEHFGELQ